LAQTETRSASADRWIAQTSINYRRDGESDNVHIPEGHEVKGLPKEVMADLYASGSIVKQSDLPSQASEKLDLQEKVDGLTEENKQLKASNQSLQQQVTQLSERVHQLERNVMLRWMLAGAGLLLLGLLIGVVVKSRPKRSSWA